MGRACMIDSPSRFTRPSLRLRPNSTCQNKWLTGRTRDSFSRPLRNFVHHRHCGNPWRWQGICCAACVERFPSRSGGQETGSAGREAANREMERRGKAPDDRGHVARCRATGSVRRAILVPGPLETRKGVMRAWPSRDQRRGELASGLAVSTDPRKSIRGRP